jgi:hypothetical protein
LLVAVDHPPSADETGEQSSQRTAAAVPATIDAARRRIEEILQKEVEFKFVEMPLHDICAYISDLHNISIVIDAGSLDEEGMSDDVEITLVLSGITLRSALNLILEPLGMDVIVGDEVLKVTSALRAAERFETRVYDVFDLAAAGFETLRLAKVIVATTGFDAVDDGSRNVSIIESRGVAEWHVGNQSLVALPGCLVICQTQPVHAEIAELLRLLRLHTGAKPQTDPQQTVAENARAHIVAAFAATTEINFIDTPLSDAVDYLAHLHDINILFDELALEEEGITTDESISQVLSGVRLDSTLRILLEPLGLVAVIEDEVLKITTEIVAENKRTTRLYDVSDLATGNLKAQDFARAVQATGTAVNWANSFEGDVGAVSSIHNFVVVSQTDAVHRSIEKLLAQLRRVLKNRKPAGG